MAIELTNDEIELAVEGLAAMHNSVRHHADMVDRTEASEFNTRRYEALVKKGLAINLTIGKLNKLRKNLKFDI